MNRNFRKRSQGEIFGIALFFVIIIVGIIIYGRFVSYNNLSQGNTQTEEKYKLLAEGTLNSLLKLSTGCDKNLDSLKDVINYCLDTGNSGQENPIYCEDESYHPSSCEYAKEILEQNLESLYSDGILGNIPYEFIIELPQYPSSSINGNFTNLESKFGITTPKERREAGYAKAPSGRISWVTSKRNVNFELNLYYK